MKIKKSFTLLYKYWEFWTFKDLNIMFLIGNNRNNIIKIRRKLRNENQKNKK